MSPTRGSQPEVRVCVWPRLHGENGAVESNHGPGNLNMSGPEKTDVPQRFMPTERRREL